MHSVCPCKRNTVKYVTIYNRFFSLDNVQQQKKCNKKKRILRIFLLPFWLQKRLRGYDTKYCFGAAKKKRTNETANGKKVDNKLWTT